MEKSDKVFVKIDEFLDYLEIDITSNKLVQKLLSQLDCAPKFPFFCSAHFADLIKNSANPAELLKEVLPLTKEKKEVLGFVNDPVGDLKAGKTRCILQKYKGRALIVSTSTCGVRCRFCFRKNFPFQDSVDTAVIVNKWLKKRKDIWEIILSGGDPLALSPQKLKELICAIQKYESVTTLRIHSRMPIMRPLWVRNHLNLLKELPKRFHCVFVVHVNHPDELDEFSYTFFEQIKKNGWVVLNQSVLLKGINDSENILVHLSLKLFEQGVLPYYIHQLDKAKGVAHFEISDKKALELLEKIRQKLPGYLVPKLVREIAGEKSKTPICD